MYPNIVCFCGNDIGSIYYAFTDARKDKFLKKFGKQLDDVDPSMIAISDYYKMDLDDIFEQFHIDKECCRIRLMTNAQLNDLL